MLLHAGRVVLRAGNRSFTLCLNRSLLLAGVGIAVGLVGFCFLFWLYHVLVHVCFINYVRASFWL